MASLIKAVYCDNIENTIASIAYANEMSRLSSSSRNDAAKTKVRNLYSSFFRLSLTLIIENIMLQGIDCLWHRRNIIAAY